MVFVSRRALSRSLAGVVVAFAGWLPVSGAGAATTRAPRPIVPPSEPASNFQAISLQHILVSIDAARESQEGLGPLRFDVARFNHLSVPEQVFVISNLERTTRGLYPALEMVARLNAIATSAARLDVDPIDAGATFSSIWMGTPSALRQYALFADFGWMYGDGPPPQSIFHNMNCWHAGQRGCWGHRNNILSSPVRRSPRCPQAQLVTGAGFVLGTSIGPSVTQIFEVACSPVASEGAFTWRQAVLYLRIPPSEAAIAHYPTPKGRG